jgi:uncharacterized protein
MKTSSRFAVSTRILFGSLGWCAVALALAGVILPGLPTTVFVIAASYCFAKSSPRFNDWLHANRWLGPKLRRFARHGGMPPSAKRAALAAMWTAVLLSTALLARTSPAAAIVTVSLGLVGTGTILFAVRTVPEELNVDATQ